MLPERGTEEYKSYITNVFTGKTHHKYYEKSVRLQKEMGVHVSGDSPGELINKQRPNEPDDIHEYRIQIWQPITKPEFGKIQAVINRIFNPRYYSIQFGEKPQKIPDEVSMDRYMKEKYPYYRSYIVFIQQVLLPKMLEDPNAICCIKPKYFEYPEMDMETIDIEEIMPIPQIYMSAKLLDFKPDKYYVIDLTDYDDSPYRKKKQPDKIQIITDVYIADYEKGELKNEYVHNLGFAPAFRLGGIVIEDEYPYVYESFISAILAHWNKAVMLQSDLDAQINLHAYLEKWEYQGIDCEACDMGWERIPPGGFPENYERQKCKVCGGTGRVAQSPFHIYQINSDALQPGETPPTPPAGYIEKPIDIIQWMDTLIDKYIEKGFKAVNMDIVNQVGEVQSGIAKTIDRQDLDAFLNNISNHLFDYIIPNIIEFTIAWMYVSNGTIKEIKDYEYNIIKPARFDVMSVQYLMDEFRQARDAGIDNIILNGMQSSIVEKMFTGQERSKLIAGIKLNTLAGLSDDTIMANRSLINDVDLYIRIYVNDLIDEAMKGDGFLMLSSQEQKTKIRELAQQRIQQNKPNLIPSGEGQVNAEQPR